MSLLSEGLARDDAIKDSKEFINIQMPFEDDDCAEHEHKDQANIFVCCPKQGNL